MSEPEVIQEEDATPVRAIALAAGVALAVILLAIAWAYREAFAPGGPTPAALPLSTPRVAGVLQTPIAPSRPPVTGETSAAADAYAWVDRDRGEIRIPIEAAMQLVAQGVEP